MSSVSPDTTPTSHNSPIEPKQAPPKTAAKVPTKEEAVTDAVAKEVFAIPEAPPAPAPHKITINPKFMSEEYAEKFKEHTKNIETTRQKLQEIDTKISKTQLKFASEDYEAEKKLLSSQKNAQTKEAESTRTAAHKPSTPPQAAKIEEESSLETKKTQAPPPKGPHDTKIALAASQKADQAEAADKTKKRQKEIQELNEFKKDIEADQKKTAEIAQRTKRARIE